MARTGSLCIDCGVRRIDRSISTDNSLCGPCNSYAEWENTHSDNAHDNINNENHDGLPADFIVAELEIMVDCPVCHPELDPRNVKIRKGHTNTVAKTHTSHADHAHPATPKARAMCRKLMAAGQGPLDVRTKKS